jgi:CD109 antigen
MEFRPEPTWRLGPPAQRHHHGGDVRVEEYVLPKYEVKVDLAKQWFLVDEAITGHVAAQYSFGKPVRGELQVKASRYVGVWEEFATFTAPINAEADFEIKPAGFLAGVPEAGGQGNVTLDVTVVERATGYEEKTTELVTVAASPVNVQIIPESPSFKPSLPFNLLIVTETPDGEPVEAAVNVEVAYMDRNFAQVGREQKRVETKRGTAIVTLTPPAAGAVTMTVTATSGDAYATKEVAAGYSPSGTSSTWSRPGRCSSRPATRPRSASPPPPRRATSTTRSSPATASSSPAPAIRRRSPSR